MPTILQYVEIEDVREIGRLNRALGQKLRAGLLHQEKRTIGYPRGSFPAKVRFEGKNGVEVFWWCAVDEAGKGYATNFFGRGAPGQNKNLNIDVQFNLPLETFTRTRGGTFVEDRGTGQVFLAHRGIVTLGHGRVKKDDLLNTIVANLCDVETSVGSDEMILIAGLESSTLVADIGMFARDLRRAAKLIGTTAVRKSKTKGRQGKRSSRKAKRSAKAPGSGLAGLKQYLDEFSGKVRIKGRKPTVADYLHGTVVGGLAEHYKKSKGVLSNKAIDLVAQGSKKVLLFEAKTSAVSQSVYTAIGQLFAHEPAVEQYLPGLPIQRVIVLPALPAQALLEVLSQRLHIQITTYARAGKDAVTFANLPQLEAVR